MHVVELMVRRTCGSCERVREQITPVVASADAHLTVVGEEFACWEVDSEELAEALLW